MVDRPVEGGSLGEREALASETFDVYDSDG